MLDYGTPCGSFTKALVNGSSWAIEQDEVFKVVIGERGTDRVFVTVAVEEFDDVLAALKHEGFEVRGSVTITPDLL